VMTRIRTKKKKQGKHIDANKQPKKYNELIVAASLLENIPNLAGLTRSCDIFAVSELAISNKRVERDSQFKRISMSAHHWVPIVEVNLDALPNYLLEKKIDGYSIIAIEQTSKSVELHHFTFPKRCVLLLGQEQTGIPADYLQIVDHCVEIPQFGMIRSLNAHVSASIVLWQYCCQQSLKKQVHD